jgi:DNA-binding XRE family transcriptional regulator
VGSPFVRRYRLATELVRLREGAGYSSEQVAKRAGISRATVSRLENGRTRPHLDDVRRILDVYQVGEPQRSVLSNIAREAQERGWWERYADEMGVRQAQIANLETGAISIREYHMTLIPGLLQIPAYTEARILADRGAYAPTFDARRAMEARLARQQILTCADPPTYEVVIDELAIRRLAAPPSVVGRQLDHLIQTGYDQPHITIRLLPLAARIRDHALPRSPFYAYTYPDPNDPVVVAVDTVTADLVLTDLGQVAYYVDLFERLVQAALSPADSLDVLTAQAEEFAQQTRI